MIYVALNSIMALSLITVALNLVRKVFLRQNGERIILYILNNPVKAGLVNEWKDWKFAYVNPEFGEW